MTPRLQVTDLHIHAVGPIHLSIAAGACVGLAGPSGSGKSLLLRAIADMERHDGSVFLDGEAQERVAAPQWRRQVGLMPAESAWWFDRVGDHFARSDTSAWQRMGLDEKMLAWPVSRLSSGERQRLALLRVLANRPKVLLLDEPTANLDEVNAARVEALILAFRREAGAAVLWVGHQPAQLRRVADRVLGLVDGRLTAEKEIA